MALKPKEHFHGSDLEKIEAVYGIKKEDIISFSANVNPLGVSFRLKETLTNHIDAITTYPDREYTSLRKCIADYVHTNYKNIVAGIQKISSKISDKIQLLYNECRGCTVVELLVTWIFCIWEEKKKIVSRVLDFFGSNITFLFLCGECATNTKISDRRLLSIDIFVFVKRERHTKRIGIKT